MKGPCRLKNDFCIPLRHDLGRDLGLRGWDRQHCPFAGLMISAQQMLGRRRQLTPSTIGFRSPWVLAGMLQQREGRIWGEMQWHPANRANASLLIAAVSPRSTQTVASPLTFSKKLQPMLCGRTRCPGFPTSHPRFLFFSSRVWLQGGRGGKGSSSILMGSLTRSSAEVSIHPRGYLKRPETSLNETPRWVGVWGRRGEWEQREGETKEMSSMCARDQICHTRLPFPRLPANREGRQLAG